LGGGGVALDDKSKGNDDGKEKLINAALKPDDIPTAEERRAVRNAL
jgi:hypothetical protein